MSSKQSIIQDHFQSIRYTDEQLLNGDYVKLLKNENLLQLLVNRIPPLIFKELKDRHGSSKLSRTALYERTNQAYDFVASKVGTSRDKVKEAMKAARLKSTGSVTAKRTAGSLATTGTTLSAGNNGAKVTTADRNGSRLDDTVDVKDPADVPSGDISPDGSALAGHKKASTGAGANTEPHDKITPSPIKKVKLYNKGFAKKSASPPVILKLSKGERAMSAPENYPPIKLPKLYNKRKRAATDPTDHPPVKLRILYNPKKRNVEAMGDDNEGPRPKVPKLKLNFAKFRRPASAVSPIETATTPENQVASAAQDQGHKEAAAPSQTSTKSDAPSASVKDQSMPSAPRKGIRRSPRNLAKNVSSPVAHESKPDPAVAQARSANDVAATSATNVPSSAQVHQEAVQKTPVKDGRDSAHAADSGHPSSDSSPLSSLRSSPEIPSEHHENPQPQATSTDDPDDSAIAGTLALLASDDAFLLELTDKNWVLDAKLSDHDALLRAAARHTTAGIVAAVNKLHPGNVLTVRQVQDRVYAAKRIVSSHRRVSYDQVDAEFKRAVAAHARAHKHVAQDRPEAEQARSDVGAYYSPAGREFYKGEIKKEVE